MLAPLFTADFFRALMDGSHALLLIKDADGKYVYVNSAAAEFTGVRAEEMIGRNEMDFLHNKEKAARFREEDIRVLTSDSAIKYPPYLAIDASGKPRWLRTTKRRVIHPETNDGLVVVEIHPMDGMKHPTPPPPDWLYAPETDQIQQFTQELRTSRDRLEFCRRAVEFARIHLNVDRCSIYLRSPGMLLGTYGTDDQGLTRDETTLLIPDDPLHSLLVEAERKGRTWMKFPGRSEELSSHGVHHAEVDWVCGTLLMDEKRPLGLMFYDMLLTRRPFDERRQKWITFYCSVLSTLLCEMGLDNHSDNNRDFRLLFQQAPLASFIANREGRLLVCNERFVRLVGGSSTSAVTVRLSCQQLLGEEQFRHLLRWLSSKGPLENFELELQAADGRTVPVVAHLNPRLDERNHVVGIHAMMVEVAEQRALLEVLLRLDRVVALPPDENFFNQLAAHLAKALDVPIAAVAEPIPGVSSAIRLLGQYFQGQEYARNDLTVEGSACTELLKHEYFAVLDDLASRYPGCAMYRELKLRAFMGVAMRATDGSPLGHVYIMSAAPIANEHRIKSVLRLFGSRAASELERRRRL